MILEEIKQQYPKIPLGKAKNLCNQKFGKLQPLYRTKNRIQSSGKSRTQWVCLCDCGNVTLVLADHLKEKHTQSCGCFAKETTSKRSLNDLTGQRFGKLLVLERAQDYIVPSTQKHKVQWLCKCDCGKELIIRSGHLITGGTQSCGCNRQSQGEQAIINILSAQNIPFETQKAFETCRFKNTNSFAYFDFYLPKENILIEYDGEQHYKPVTFNGIDINHAEEKFTQNLIRDEYKNEWCRKNNIPLIRIPYTHLQNISLEDLQLETTKFRVV